MRVKEENKDSPWNAWTSPTNISYNFLILLAIVFIIYKTVNLGITLYVQCAIFSKNPKSEMTNGVLPGFRIAM